MSIEKLLHLFNNVKDIINIISTRIKKAAISAYSGQSAFFMMLSFFPFLMFIFALLKYTPFDKNELIAIAAIFLPDSFKSFLTELINDIYLNQSATMLPVTIIISLWLGSKSFISLIQGINSVNEIEEDRNFIVIRFFSVLYTIAFAALIIATLTIMVFGNVIYYYVCRYFPILGETVLYIISLRPVISFIIMSVFFTIMYVVLPNRKTKLSRQIPGALIASCGWIIFSYLYSFYIDHYSNYSTFYGAMTIIALLMVWLYCCMYILFLGSFINYLLEQEHISDYLKLLKKEL